MKVAQVVQELLPVLTFWNYSDFAVSGSCESKLRATVGRMEGCVEFRKPEDLCAWSEEEATGELWLLQKGVEVD